MSDMPSFPLPKLVAFAPAKINLLLAITGLRPDGFHSLTSLVAPLNLGDTLWLESAPTGQIRDSLSCAMPGVPTDGTNLVLRAAALFRENFPALSTVHLTLGKDVPHGAGLGGGSTDAASALLLLNEFSQFPLQPEKLRELAAHLGSDCPLFLSAQPVIMRGRGEEIESLSAEETAALRGKKLLLFKPDFGVSTAGAYGAMKASQGADYISAAEADSLLAAWRKAPATAPLPLLNNMERPVFAKHLALPALLDLLREKFALTPRMSGSGSACFAFLPAAADVAAIRQTILEAWGDSAFVRLTSLR